MCMLAAWFVGRAEGRAVPTECLFVRSQKFQKLYHGAGRDA